MNLERAKKYFIFDYDDASDTTKTDPPILDGTNTKYVTTFDISQYRCDILNRPCFVKWVYGIVQTKNTGTDNNANESNIFLSIHTNIPNINSLDANSGGPSDLLFAVDSSQLRQLGATTKWGSYNYNHSGEGFYCPALPPQLIVRRILNNDRSDIGVREVKMKFRLQIQFLD